VNGVDLVLRALRHGETHLAVSLAAVAERHRADHEVHHVSTDLARWSRDHARRLAGIDPDRGTDPDAPPQALAGMPPAPGEEAAEATADRPETGLLLLRDLCDPHLGAARNSLHWEMLAQAAQAARREDLLALVSACHPQTLRQMRWTNTLIKNLSPQILTSPRGG
jgi:hypothetical protein